MSAVRKDRSRALEGFSIVDATITRVHCTIERGGKREGLDLETVISVDLSAFRNGLFFFSLI